MSSGCRTRWPDVLSNSSGKLKNQSRAALVFFLSTKTQHIDLKHSHVLQFLHNHPVDHVGHVCRDFAGREAKLAVEQLVDVAQRVCKSVPQLPADGGTVGFIRQLSLQALLLL